MSRRTLKIAVDAAMFCLMLALLSYPLTRGLLRHGVMGMAFTGLVLLHHYLNLAWYKSLAKGRWTGERLLVTITDTGLLFATMALLASSLVMAGEVFSFAPFAMPWWGRELHMGATAWIYVLSCVHLGLHITRPVRFLQRHLGRTFWPMACALMLPSMYAFWLSGIWMDLLLWGDPKRPPRELALFILQYLGAGLALCLPAHALMRLARKKGPASAYKTREVHMKLKSLLPILLAGLIVTGPVTGLSSTAMAGSPQGKAAVQAQSLSARQRAIIGISAHTAGGDLARLKPALAKGLEAGLAVNEIKEILVQLYAYTGFPRSLNAIHTFMALMDERQKAGIQDEMGKEASPMPKDLDRDQYGAKTRATLGGKDSVPPPAGYQLFAPAIDSFLKEHLFADIFYRDNLDWQSRELATISALAAMTGTAGQQRFHMNAAMNTGLDEAQMRAFIEVVHSEVGEALANVSSSVLEDILAKRKK